MWGKFAYLHSDIKRHKFLIVFGHFSEPQTGRLCGGDYFQEEDGVHAKNAEQATGLNITIYNVLYKLCAIY